VIEYPEKYFQKKGRTLCAKHAHELDRVCASCSKPISDQAIVLRSSWDAHTLTASTTLSGEVVRCDSEDLDLLSFHKECFVCHFPGCNKSLLKHDFVHWRDKPFCNKHGKAISSCASCKKKIEDPSAPVVMSPRSGRVSHVFCLHCDFCGIDLAVDESNPGAAPEYRDGKFQCHSCFKILKPKCTCCGESIGSGLVKVENGEVYHSHCFKCSVCNSKLEIYRIKDGELRCKTHKKDVTLAAERTCFSCRGRIGKSKALKIAGRDYHKDCCVCHKCLKAIKSPAEGVLRNRLISCIDCVRTQRRITTPSRFRVFGYMPFGIKRNSSNPSLASIEEKSETSSISPENVKDLGLDDPLPEIKFDRGKKIGEGSYGKVFVGRRIPDNSLIAIKEMELPFISRAELELKLDPCSEAHFKEVQREVQILRKLDHPNIVKFLGADLDSSSHVFRIFMEYVPGHSMSDHLKLFGKYSEESIKEISRQILHGLAYLHSQKVVHRDLKSGNILISDKGVPKLADFGSAKLSKSSIDKSMAVSGRYVGTPLFSPPELLIRSVYTHKSDIWSFGCVLIEMSCARLPWAECEFTTPFAAMYHIAQVGNLPQLPMAISSLFRDFILCCLVRDPKARWSAEQLLTHEFLQ